MNQVERLRFWVPRMDWIVSANEMNAEPVPNASPIRKFSRREYYILPLSFLALLIFPSNAGQAAAGAGGRTLREVILFPSFFSATQESALFLSSLQLSRFCIERMAELGPSPQIMFEPMFKPNPSPYLIE